jgi:2-haloacid dehalogenase
MKTTIDTIIFDLGGVLVDWKPEYLYRKVFNNDEDKVQWFLKTVCTPDWNIEQDAGRTIEDAVNSKVAEFPEYEAWIRLFYLEWHQMFSGPIKENLKLFKKLKKDRNYKIYALTNWSAEKWEKGIELFPFFKEFDGVVVSGQEKTRKPFDEIYHILLNRFNITPNNAVFIDDNKQNVDASKRLNINGIHFTTNSKLAKDLDSFNIQR